MEVFQLAYCPCCDSMHQSLEAIGHAHNSALVCQECAAVYRGWVEATGFVPDVAAFIARRGGKASRK